jgi:hypothetical protein
LVSPSRVCGVQSVMAKGTPAMGKVWPSAAVPMRGCTRSEGETEFCARPAERQSAVRQSDVVRSFAEESRAVGNIERHAGRWKKRLASDLAVKDCSHSES